MDVRWHDIQTKGYVVVPSAFDAAELKLLIDEYDRASTNSNKNYNLKLVGASALEAMRPKLLDIAARLMAHSDIHIDRVQGGAYFAIEAGVDFGWHQDHESWYVGQDHYNHLNFYLPIVKPSREKTNLSIIPTDVLATHAPRFGARRKGRGACYELVSKLGMTVFRDDDLGAFSLVRVHFDSIAVTPELEAGDLLILRGDVFHRTQDTETQRVSVSFRLLDEQAMISRKTLARMSVTKAIMMVKNRSFYQAVFDAFDAANSNHIRLREALAMIDARNDAPVELPVFLKTLVRAAIRARFG